MDLACAVTATTITALIQGGFSAIDGGSGADLRIVKGFCVCSSGRPIRAKELRSWFGKKWTRHSSPKDGIDVVYQENHGQVRATFC